MESKLICRMINCVLISYFFIILIIVEVFYLFIELVLLFIDNHLIL